MKKLTKIMSTGIAAVLATASLAACGSTETTTADSGTTAAPTAMKGAINVYTRDSSSGTRGAFEELIGFEGELTAGAAETSGNGDMAAKVGQDKNAVGYVSLTTDFEANNLKAVSFEGVEATEENVLDGSYSLKRPFSYTTRAEDDFESEEIKALTLAFLDYLNNSTEGREVVALEGGITDVAGGTAWEELAANHAIAAQDNSGLTLRTAGSTSVDKTLKAALESFQPLAGNFQFVMNQTGSGDGFKRTLGEEKDSANAAEIGFASRDFKAEETVADALESGVYCQDAVVVVVESSNAAVESLTKQQVYDIFTGAVSNWEELK